MNSYKNKVWKEFIKLKIWEIGLFLYSVIIPYWLGGFSYNYFPNVERRNLTFYERWMNGLIINLIIAFIILLGYLWIRGNWNWAIKRVKKQR